MGMDSSAAMRGVTSALGPPFSYLSGSGCKSALAAFRKTAWTSWPFSRASLRTGGRSRLWAQSSSVNGGNYILTSCCATTRTRHQPVDTSEHDLEQLLKCARQSFCEEIAFSKRDDEISLAKGALLIAAEDEAFLSMNNQKDLMAVQQEGRMPVVSSPPKTTTVFGKGGGAAGLHLGGIPLSDWLAKFDHLSRQVEAHLGSNANERTTVAILKSMNTVIFKLLGFTRKTYLSTDSRSFYLQHVLNHGCASAVMLGILFIDLCQRLGLKMHGAAVGESFVIWPAVEGKQLAFEPREGCKSWFMAGSSDQSPGSPNAAQGTAGPCPSRKSSTHEKLKPASNREILQISLQNLKRLHWKQASRACEGLSLASPLLPLAAPHCGSASMMQSMGELLRPQELRLALAASERLVLLNPQNWSLRKDHGMLLFHSRRYGDAVQELSICMAFAPTHEMELLEPFVEKLHLMRLETSWSRATKLNNPPAIA